MPSLVDLHYLTHQLAEADGPADLTDSWPERLWSILADHGAFSWLIPDTFGGQGLDRVTLMIRYMAIAEGSLTAAFMLSQHDAALRRMIPAAIADPNGSEGSAAWWVRRVVTESLGVTIGISQLTTSIRRGERAMTATPLSNGGFRLEGSMPWVTGAERAACFVTGGTLEDGRQILCLVPADRKGVQPEYPEPLAALNASRTAEVRCQGVDISSKEVLAGPMTNVITSRQAGGTGGLETSALALGQAKSAIERLKAEDPSRFGLEEPVESLDKEWESVRKVLFDLVSQVDSPITPEQVRRRANALVSRATQACLIARRGSGFLLSDPAQRWARQALFFHVWSCPKPVATASLRDLAGVGDSSACPLG
jgi:hypothetical protein